ncbi:MAG: hypothetical protein FJZ47_06990 [Candidatus Tectomicrobia bacterium]|uniref:Cytochrome c domain-containing protein n=1 Tax=Tectimicrobiota bacterium TaxID=2528274 RepID=A0A938B212_UNCTE|nr:hypothetical protein [Candidatus Tectomicrobia bacterium]
MIWLLGILLLWCPQLIPQALAQVMFSDTEVRTILRHGPWPPAMPPDPSNRVSGHAAAIAFGRQLFFDTRLSRDHQHSCATCHQPVHAFTDGQQQSAAIARVDRNALPLLNLRLQRWFGWDGKSDSLWAQSIHPILDARELGASADLIATRLRTDTRLAVTYTQVFGTSSATDTPETILVNLAKALAAFQETLRTGRTPFDDFRDALAQGDAAAMARYPQAAQRGLQIFVGKGQCSVCHFGPNFTNGEFHDIGIPFFVTPTRVDQGRYGGIALVQASPYNLLGPFSDDPARTTASPTRYIQQLHRHWGEFRVPSLRQVAQTSPYMHNGSLPSLADVVRHYAELNEERPHTEGERLLQPLHLTPDERTDLVQFLRTLCGPILSYDGARDPAE